ncbi:MAG: pilus (MSHA type) biogenesis protein MshL [Oleiphilaceae bacterium]|nr:pilus (MSHA type) biogenesis protein MshL [Oleiphilaceae bacterium]
MRSKTKKVVMLTVGAMLVSACAHKNALMQSPTANDTESIDQINAELDAALAPAPAPLEMSSDVMAALTPQLTVPVREVAREPRFDIAVNEVPARDFFAGLVEGTRRNIVVHPEVSGNISLALRDVTVSEVLEVTKDLYGYDYQEKGRLIKVFPTGLRTKVFAINYLDVVRKGASETRVASGQITFNADSGGDSGGSTAASSSGTGTKINTSSESNFWQGLEEALKLIVGNKDGRSVVLTPAAGVAVVRANPEELAAVTDYLQSAELIMKRQVILEAKILEVELSEGYQQGIDWSFAEAGQFRDGSPRRSIDLVQSARNVSAGDVGGVFASAVSLGNFNTAIELLGTQGNVQVLSSPRIATVNNQKAVIKVGSDEYFVTDIDFESDNDTDSSSTDIELTPFFSGIALDVTPQISDEGKIILHVHPTISKVDDQQKLIVVGGREIDLPLALSTIRESDSVITAENGQIVVIGGLIQSRNEDSNSSVPFFGDLPLIGELFKQKAKAREKTELVILLRPTLTDNGTIKADLQSSRDRFGAMRETLVTPTETRFYP